MWTLVVLATLVSGCAGPWAGTSKVQLPTANATPAPLPGKGYPPVDQVDLPELSESPQVEIEVETPSVDDSSAANESDTTETSDLIIRGQTPDTVTSADGSATFRDAMPSTNAVAAPPANGGVQLAQYEQMPGPGSYAPPGGGSAIGGYNPVYTPQQGVTTPPGVAPQTGVVPPPGVAPQSGVAPPPTYGGGYDQGGYSQGGYGQPTYGSPGQTFSTPSGGYLDSGSGYGPAYSSYDGSGIAPPYTDEADYADLVVNLRETQTGRFMFGVGVNSDLGLTAQAIIDERNFDWKRWPRSIDDIVNGTAFRGGGQSLRIEAVPGTEVQRYMVNFTQPYLFDTPISFNLSAYLFDRRYFDWDEQRFGARMGMGYRITPDLSLAVSMRAEQVDFHNPRVRGIPIIEEALGESDLFSGKVSLTHDTRDLPFAATEGHYLELSYEQAFGDFDFPRFNTDYRRYFLLSQRADGSGRHTLGLSFRGGVTGSQTPVYEHFFAGGYSTMRGFRFRHASPKIADVIVGGQLSLLGTAEYIFPITADDMLKGALFCDYGTVEEEYDNIDMEDFRVAIGAGIRITVPAMGPAPIAVDFAVPLAREDTDRIQNFSFFVGFGR